MTNHTIEERRCTLAKWREKGEAYPNSFRRTTYINSIIQKYACQDPEKLAEQVVKVCIGGRVIQKRFMGKAGFLDIQDMSGRIQIYIRKPDMMCHTVGGVEEIDLGDIIGIEGMVFRTKTDELSVRVVQFWLLTKALRPLPDKFHGLQNTEMRYRQRYLDLIVNTKTSTVFKKRSHLLKAIRTFLDDAGYLEVETPMMQPMAGGATARPFVTYHNTLHKQLYLRVAPELYLKRLVIGGLEQVYELNRNFRNEGVSTRHNPEFTMLELYKAYADYKDMMNITEDLLRSVARGILGLDSIRYQGDVYDLSKPFKRLTLTEALLFYNPTLQETVVNDRHRLSQWASDYNIDINQSLGELQFSVFEATVEKQLKQPTFITSYPIEVSPLARRNSDNPDVADRFELYIGGRELANGFSELNDPEDQATRFKAQLAAKTQGNYEAMDYDADYIKALEYGLPPTGGVGIGVDRLMMLLCDVSSIRDVILFPLMRP